MPQFVMGSQERGSNWYDAKWRNRKALENRERRRQKYSALIPAPASVAAGEPGDEAGAESGPELQGVLAEFSPPLFSIFCGDQFFAGRAATEAEASLLHSLAIGDKVGFSLDQQGNATLLKSFPRWSRLARLRADASRRSLAGATEHVLAANVDLAVIVASVASPSFHPRLVDRYLVMCQYGNVTPVLCLSKIDLAPPPDVSVYEQIGLAVVRLSTKSNLGFEALLSLLSGKCCVLTGHSGVGKSSIINHLLGHEVLAVREVSDRTGRGRHTSISSSLHVIENSTWLIDTPGIRSLGLWDIEPDSLRFYFPEFAPFADQCHYRDCSHSHEPECAVREAVHHGAVPAERYESYLRLLRATSR